LLVPLTTGNTYDDTAARVAELDLVISVDTSIAHLAGALGRPTWVLLAHAADWRWHRDATRSAWYPTARLFRQPRIGDWDAVVREVVAALSASP
jgi:ADP-heptose:LPS heptosyltransferase